MPRYRDLAVAGPATTPLEPVRANERGSADMVPASLPEFSLPSGLQTAVRRHRAGETAFPLNAQDEEAARHVLVEIQAVMQHPVSDMRLGQWTAMVLAGARRQRTDPETERFMLALAFAVDEMPAALFCEATQRQAMRQIVVAPAVSEILSVIEPILRQWTDIRDGLIAAIQATDRAEHAASQDDLPAGID